MLNRNRLQFIEKWGSALHTHEPRVGELSAATERAIARADAFGRARIGLKPAAGLPPTARPPFDPILQERRLAERSRTIQKDHVDHLSRQLDDYERVEQRRS
jgi:hypothetical protein